MHVALHRPVAAGRVRVEPAARLDGEVRGFLHPLHGEIAGRVDNHRALAAHPGDDGWPVFVVMPSTGLALLTTSTCAASQRLLAAPLRLALLPSGVREVIRFHCAFELAMHLIGQRSIAQPPAPPIARTAMDPQLSGNAARGTRQAQEKRRQNPVHDRALAAVQERTGEVIEGALATLLFTPVALQSGLVVVGTPRTDVVALTPRTLEGPIFPAQYMDIGLTRCGVEEVVQMQNHRHG